MIDYHIPLFPGQQYHVLSRGIGDELLFREAINYQFFLGRYQRYISHIADTYCYCLLPNHFHFLLRIKEVTELERHFKEIKKNKLYSPELLPEFIMERFSNLLNSYAKSYNKKYNRKGGLFIDYMRRVEILNNSQFRASVFYIHKNPVHHGYCKKMDQWPWSSFNTMLCGKPTKLLRREVIDWFGGIRGLGTITASLFI